MRECNRSRAQSSGRTGGDAPASGPRPLRCAQSNGLLPSAACRWSGEREALLRSWGGTRGSGHRPGEMGTGRSPHPLRWMRPTELVSLTSTNALIPDELPPPSLSAPAPSLEAAAGKEFGGEPESTENFPFRGADNFSGALKTHDLLALLLNTFNQFTK